MIHQILAFQSGRFDRAKQPLKRAGANGVKATAWDVSKRSGVMFRRRVSQLDDSRRRVALMERMIADFDCKAADLGREILIEQQRARIHDPAHFAYPAYAKAAMLRRDNLKRSADGLRAQLAKAKEALFGARRGCSTRTVFGSVPRRLWSAFHRVPHRLRGILAGRNTSLFIMADVLSGASAVVRLPSGEAAV